MGANEIFIAAGAFVWLFGMAMLVWHVRQHRVALNDPALPPADLKFAESQYRRRIQTSALTITLGALIALFDALPQFRSSPSFSAGYVATLLLLSMWLVLLAIGDAVASRMHMQQSMRRNRLTRAALQEAIDDMRRRQEDALSSRPEDFTISSNRR